MTEEWLIIFSISNNNKSRCQLMRFNLEREIKRGEMSFLPRSVGGHRGVVAIPDREPAEGI